MNPALFGNGSIDEEYHFDRNVYFSPTTKPVQFFNGETLEQWKKRGQDAKSVIADPKFLDAAKKDFRLQPDSPAKAMGFKEFDAKQAGRRKDAPPLPATVPVAHAYPDPR